MNCRECQNNLSDYLDDRLDQARRDHIDAHRRECAECERAYRLVRRTAEVLAAEGVAEPPDDLAARAARAALTAEPRGARSFFERWIPVAWPTAAVAAAAAILLLVTSPPQAPAASVADADPVSIVLDDVDGDDFEGDVLGVEDNDEE